jgi:type IV pilus assembly protein PilF
MSGVRRGRWTAALAGSLTVALLGGCTNPQQVRNQHQAAVFNTELGVAYMQRGQLAIAQRKLDRALRENPNDPNVHSARALLFERLGEPARADREYRAALALAPHNPDYENDYAVYLCNAGRTEAGVKYFLDAARNPLYLTPADAYNNAGVCLRVAHHDQQAAKMFRAALAVSPGFEQAAWQLADLEYKRGRYPQAHALIKQFLAANSETPDMLLLAVKVARAQGDALGAQLYARRLQLDFPNSAEAHALAALGQNPG